MTLTEAKRTIIKSFKDQYGFAPTMKAITLLETSQNGDDYIAIAFAINKIGYSWVKYAPVTRAEVYDL